MLEETKPLSINRGVLEGASLSLNLYNNRIDQILDEIGKDNVWSVHGYKLNDNLSATYILGVAKDAVLIGKCKDAVISLFDMTRRYLKKFDWNLIIHTRNFKYWTIKVETCKFYFGCDWDPIY